MAVLASWPSMSDDDGTGQSGTVLDKALFDAIKASVEDQVHSTNNTGIKPKTITDEVKTARGNKTSLEDRLDGVIDSDGDLITPASIVATSQLQDSIGDANIIPTNDDFFLWHLGDALAPTGWAVSGTGVAIARTGTGLSDTAKNVGSFAAKVTFGSATAFLESAILDAAAFLPEFKSRDIGIGAWVKTNVASHARVYIDDGNSKQYTAYHTGGNAWEFLAIGLTTASNATKVTFGMEVRASGAAYLDGATVLIGGEPPSKHVPVRTGEVVIKIPQAGLPTTGDGKSHEAMAFPWMISEVYAVAPTAASGDFIIDIERSNSTGFQSIFSGAQTILANTHKTGTAIPNGTYEYRCVPGTVLDNSTNITNGDSAIVRLNIDTVNGGNDVAFFIRGWAYIPALRRYMAYNDIQG